MIFRMSCSFSLLAQRKRTKRKGTSAQGISAVRNQNPSAKAGPRLPSFLTLMASYAEGRRKFDEWSNTLKIVNSTRLTQLLFGFLPKQSFQSPIEADEHAGGTVLCHASNEGKAL